MADRGLEIIRKRMDLKNLLDQAAAKQRDTDIEELQKELKKIEQMSNKTLIDEFEDIIRKGAGPGVFKLIWMKREIIRRMDRGDIQ